MNIIKESYWKNPMRDISIFKNWIQKLEQLNGYTYSQKNLKTSLGNTKVYGLNIENNSNETLIIFPGYRTTSLLWDLDQGLSILAKKYRVFMIETNGQPNLSSGTTPAIKSLEYGEWGKEIFDALGIEKAFIAGASFGGLICMKISICIPKRIKANILLNPSCFRFVSLGYKNIYYNLLPLFAPKDKNISRFLDEIIFSNSSLQISLEAKQHLIDYLSLAINRYKDNTQKPYYMKNQLNKVKTDTYLIIGEKDVLLPGKKSVTNAKKHLGSNLKQVYYEKYGHGIELYPNAINRIYTIIESYK